MTPTLSDDEGHDRRVEEPRVDEVVGRRRGPRSAVRGAHARLLRGHRLHRRDPLLLLGRHRRRADLLSFLIRLKLSTMTPTKRFIAKKEPTNIHAIEKTAESEKSSRTGAVPGSSSPSSIHVHLPLVARAHHVEEEHRRREVVKRSHARS